MGHISRLMAALSAVVFRSCVQSMFSPVMSDTALDTFDKRHTVQPQNRSVISGGGGIQITRGGFVPGVREVMEHRGVVFGPPLL